MKKRFLIVCASVAFLVFTVATPSNAAPRVFNNCTEINKIFPGGIAKLGAINQGGSTKYVPKYDDALYAANKKSDRDGDGIACEK